LGLIAADHQRRSLIPHNSSGLSLSRSFPRNPTQRGSSPLLGTCPAPSLPPLPGTRHSEARDNCNVPASRPTLSRTREEALATAQPRDPRAHRGTRKQAVHVGHVVRRRLTLSQRGATRRPVALFRARHGARSLPSPTVVLASPLRVRVRVRVRVCVCRLCNANPNNMWVAPISPAFAHFEPSRCPSLYDYINRPALSLSLSLSLALRE